MSNKKAKVKSEKNKPEPLEKGKMVFHNETTDEKVTIDIELLDQDKVAVEIDFDPAAAKGTYEGVVANCALVVINYLREDGEVTDG